MASPTPTPLADDPFLRDVPNVDGWKVLAPAVLYAKIGQGGMGCVYRGRHLELEIDVAVKCLKPSLVAEDEQFEARFRREARLAAELTHENLVRLYELRRTHGLSYLILEFIDGETARDRVVRKGPLGEEEAATILLGAARGLAKAHRHREVIVHRDVRPENILISREGDVKLADLGIAKALEGRDSGALNSINTLGAIGTPPYMAPEQWEGGQQIGPTTDVWSMGVTLYFLLTGKTAVEGNSNNQIGYAICNKPFPDVRVLRANLSPALCKILQRCTQKDPSQRYQDASGLARDLENFLGERTASLVDHATGSVKAKTTALSPPPAHALKMLRIATLGTQTPPPGKTTEPSARPTVSNRSDDRSRVPARRKWMWIGAFAVLAIGSIAMYAIDWSPAKTRSPGKENVDHPGQRPLSQEITKISLDPPLPADGLLYCKASTIEVRGKLDNPTGDTIRLVLNGKGSDYDLVDGRSIKIDPTLARDARSKLELIHGGASVKFDVIQDSIDPQIEIVAPSESARRTHENSIDIVAKVSDANLAQVSLGTRRMEREGDGLWHAAGVGLPKENENSFAILARDKAGREGKFTLVVVRDAQGPRLVGVDPGENSELDAGSDVTLRLTFDEGLSLLTVADKPATVTGEKAVSLIHVSAGAGAFSVSWRATDLAENVSTGSLAFTRRVKPTVRAPEGWDILDPSPGFGGWAKKVREPKSQIVFLLVAPGKFQMGSPASEEGRQNDEQQHEVEITKPFYLAETEVTQAQYERVAKTNPSNFKGADLPVEQVDWNQSRAFCKSIGCDLPTEAQWEYACRAGSATAFSLGQSLSAGQANFGQSSNYHTDKVKSYPANAWGFFDMHGNVWEWCLDGYDSNFYTSGPRKDPLAPFDGASYRVFRGGGFFGTAVGLRSAYRYDRTPVLRSSYLGLRPAMGITP